MRRRGAGLRARRRGQTDDAKRRAKVIKTSVPQPAAGGAGAPRRECDLSLAVRSPAPRAANQQKNQVTNESQGGPQKAVRRPQVQKQRARVRVCDRKRVCTTPPAPAGRTIAERRREHARAARLTLAAVNASSQRRRGRQPRRLEAHHLDFCVAHRPRVRGRTRLQSLEAAAQLKRQRVCGSHWRRAGQAAVAAAAGQDVQQLLGGLPAGAAREAHPGGRAGRRSRRRRAVEGVASVLAAARSTQRASPQRARARAAPLADVRKRERRRRRHGGSSRRRSGEHSCIGFRLELTPRTTGESRAQQRPSNLAAGAHGGSPPLPGLQTRGIAQHCVGRGLRLGEGTRTVFQQLACPAV